MLQLDAKMARTMVPRISLADSLPLATKISCCLQTCLGHVGQVAPTGIPTSCLGNDCQTIVAIMALLCQRLSDNCVG